MINEELFFEPPSLAEMAKADEKYKQWLEAYENSDEQKKRKELYSVIGFSEMIIADYLQNPPRIRTERMEQFGFDKADLMDHDLSWIIHEEIPSSLLAEYKRFNTYLKISYALPSFSVEEDAFPFRTNVIWLVRRMINRNISPNNEYYSNLDPKKIDILMSEEISADIGFKKLKRMGLKVSPFLEDTEEGRDAAKRFIRDCHKCTATPARFAPLAVGSGSVITLFEDTSDQRIRYACKYVFVGGINRRKEYALLYYKGRSKNVINLFDDSGITGLVTMGMADGGIKLEYLRGKTLDQVISEGILNQEKVIRYAGGILNGLLELRQAGIWHHRDIRPANIMLREEDDQAVILDLGIATKDKDALPKDNKRFGGPNDLVSLGQVIYFMAAGKHLFTDSDSMNVTKIKRSIADEREQVYADTSGKLLREYLLKVRTEIAEGRIKSLAEICLTAKGTDEDYKTLEARFKEYGA